MIDYLRRRLITEDGPVPLRRLLAGSHSERALICMFLAMLELVRLQTILLRQPANFGEIYVKRGEAFESQTADSRDDWR
jgi:segregation and condensation protein A